jgi:hypothetical protein
VSGRKFHRGAVIVPAADRARLEPMLRDLGLSAWAVSSVPDVKTHDLDVPRIGYVHNWSRTQDEGWWRAALDAYGIPYTYFADQKLKEGNLRAKYDVILFPHVGGSAVSQVNGTARTGSAPLPYRKSADTPHLRVLDSSDDIRGGMGFEGLAELAKFVEQGGTLITEGSTATIFPEYGLTSDVTVEQPAQLFVRGSVMLARISDASSPIAYGYAGTELPVYFNQAPVLNAGRTGRGGGSAAPQRPNAGLGQSITPNASPLRISAYAPGDDAPAEPGNERPRPEDIARLRDRPAAAPAAAATGRGNARTRVVLQFPSDPAEMLLSGTLANGKYLANRAAAVDSRVGEGHVVMFAIRPFWRWQTHGTYTLGFNAIMHWNDLDARGN